MRTQKFVLFFQLTILFCVQKGDRSRLACVKLWLRKVVPLPHGTLVMDACASTRLPPGVASTRLPAWLLPHVPPDVLKRLRPDMLIIHGLDLPTFHSLSLLLAAFDSPTIASLKSTCTIHLVEQGKWSFPKMGLRPFKARTALAVLASLGRGDRGEGGASRPRVEKWSANREFVARAARCLHACIG